MRTTKPLALVLSLTACMATACSSGGDNDKPRSTAAPTAASSPSVPPEPQLVPHDPPAWFDTGKEVALPSAATKGRLNLAGRTPGGGSVLPLVLADGRAIIASPDRLQAFNLATGQVEGEIAPQGQVLRPDSDGDVLPPLVVGGVALAPFLITEPASGTRAAGAALELLASPATGRPAVSWRTVVKVPDWVTQSSGAVQVSAVGAGGGTVVVTLAGRSGSGKAISYGIDMATHALRWTQQDVEVRQVGDGAATGLLHVENLDSIPVSFDLATGAERWRGEKVFQAGMYDAGPAAVRVRGHRPDGKYVDQLIAPDSGRVRGNMPSGLSSIGCTHDEAKTLLCFGSAAVTAVDPADGRMLWQLKEGGDDGRRVPQITAVWHGRVYGIGPAGPVTLDALTGTDMPTKPEAAPILVNAYVGLVLDEGRLTGAPTGG
ncbi:PQQ-like beta-propeller repeat protein [Streptomyces sp. NBC_01551]|uniref:PQQ-binding-like beta-propeller repeat protein n=1 Tax=Streptomyces sp. NBC_01551 TaxID=2975876 RepID=UPI0022525095|nr:PQQ-binding-like beta-propeller repeat protein [Streptomyces sp. NBC_01551]MCX4529840.1 PQQ-like beta-propeller repeat protein [Streptomyces sp. NBC_01551]